MWTAGLFDELLLLRAKQGKIRIQSQGSRAGEYLSPLSASIGENIPEKREESTESWFVAIGVQGRGFLR